MARPTPKPTDEQTDILNWISDPSHLDSTQPKALLILAGPGTGKSTLIRMAAKAAPTRYRPSIQVLSFNKDIAKENTSYLPFPIISATVNSFALTIWNSYSTVRPVLSIRKNKEIIRRVQADDTRWSISPDEVDDLVSLMKAAKSQGWVPKSAGVSIPNGPTISDLYGLTDVKPQPHYEGLLTVLMNLSIKAAFEGEIDFDDQVYVTALFAPSTHLPAITYLFVDEAQDLSPIQLWLIQRVKAKITIFVGDPLQSIYAFRGAMSDSFARIQAAFPGADTLPLQTSFRLPREIVGILRDHNPRLKTFKQTKGTVETLTETAPFSHFIERYASEGTKAVLCRNNGPLYSIALSCIATATPFNLNDQGWGNGIIRDLKKVSGNPTTQDLSESFIQKLLSHWTNNGDESLLDKAMDKLYAIASLAETTGAKTVAALITTIQSLLKKANESDKINPVLLSTVHKAKGLEFDTVFHLDSHLIPSKFAKTEEDFAQEANIRYVLNSRARESLYFLTSPQILTQGNTKRSKPKQFRE